jgi:hypothetical protein
MGARFDRLFLGDLLAGRHRVEIQQIARGPRFGEIQIANLGFAELRQATIEPFRRTSPRQTNHPSSIRDSYCHYSSGSPLWNRLP